MYKLPVAKLNELYAAIAAVQTLYLPIRSAAQVNYSKWAEGADVQIECLKTVKSAKDAFFPQTENLIHFNMDGKNIEINAAAHSTEDYVLFGVRACDMASFGILDSVFLADPVDTYYQARRAHGTIITHACHEPDTSCFCNVFGIDSAAPGGDISCWTVGDELYWQPLTDKGAALTKAVKSLLSDADEAKVAEQQSTIRATMEKLPFAHLDMSQLTGDNLKALFDSPKWAELSQACIGCGTCTFVCPTCQCYDIRDFNTGSGIQRYRCWDSCMYKDFTMMAHGTPRPTQLQRFRQRFMHKLCYYPANNEGRYSCVGCGRCVDKCPISMNIVKVIKALGVKENV